MTDHPRILGSLRTEGGVGVVRLEDRFDTDPADLWSALTDPERLSRWLGAIEGDLVLGGEFRAFFHASGWEGTGRIEVCDPPHRLRVQTQAPGQASGAFDMTLTADGDATILVVEDYGVPPEDLPAYGAGNQIHVEDLRSYLAGGERCDSRARWSELHPGYLALLTQEQTDV